MLPHRGRRQREDRIEKKERRRIRRHRGETEIRERGKESESGEEI